MLIAASLKQLLERHKLAYRVLQHKRVSNVIVAASLLNIELKNVLHVQVLNDQHGEVLVVHPVGRKIDFARCQQFLKRNLNALPAIEVNRIFNDCEADSWPAVGQIYNLDIIIDQSLQHLDQVYFASGSHTAMIQMSIEDFFVLNARAKVLAITTEQSADHVAHVLDQPVADALIFADLTFPALPPVAMQILELSISNEHSTKELVELVAQDPAMQQQIMFYTQLPFIQEKFRAEVAEQTLEDVQHVVDHILGFDMVSHIALGVAAGRAFNLQRISGLEDFWRHAFYAASYAERITELVADNLALDPAISYMAGLFHNFGLLLFSQLYPPEYGLLKKWIALNPKVSISVLEQRVLGMGQAFTVVRGGHAQLGEWLLRSWHMPESICVITREHHSATYKGKYLDYVRIIQLTNQLLRADGIGDGTTNGVSEQLLESLGLTAQQVYQSIEQVKAGAASLDNMARSLTNSA